MHPTVTILAVARYDHQAKLATQLGAHLVLPHHPTENLIHRIAEETGSSLNEPWVGLPMLNGGVDAVYDTVSSAETMEVDLRVTRSFGTMVIIGVEPAKTFEWTPLYFKEISIIGSNGFGIEEFEGQRKHAMEWYSDFIEHRALDVTPIITHHYAMRDYRSAFMTCYNQGKSSGVKGPVQQFFLRGLRPVSRSTIQALSEASSPSLRPKQSSWSRKLAYAAIRTEAALNR